MKYTVVVKKITSSNGSFIRKRFNNVSKRIIKFLANNRFSFSVGIFNNIVNRNSAENYIEVYEKTLLPLDNAILYNKLKKLSKRKMYK